MLEADWRAVYGEAPLDEQKAEGTEGDEDDAPDQVRPPLEEGEAVRCTEVASMRVRPSRPPLRRGRLASRWRRRQAGRGRRAARGHEGLGIGTPATRASIIERLIDVGYIVRDGRRLQQPTKAPRSSTCWASTTTVRA